VDAEAFQFTGELSQKSFNLGTVCDLKWPLSQDPYELCRFIGFRSHVLKIQLIA